MKNSILLLILFMSSLSISAMGLADWSDTTKNGTIFYNAGGGTEMFYGDSSLRNVTKFYFYNDHIIGESLKSHFIYDELKNKMSVYDTEQSWQTAIENRDLQPKFWKRTFTSDWKILESFFFIGIIYCFFSILLVGVFIFKSNESVKSMKVIIFNFISTIFFLVVGFLSLLIGRHFSFGFLAVVFIAFVIYRFKNQLIKNFTFLILIIAAYKVFLFLEYIPQSF